jgi:hypothetical protein
MSSGEMFVAGLPSKHALAKANFLKESQVLKHE